MTERRSAAAPYSGYLKRDVPREDDRLTHTGPGTPCGELMRRYWQPVALAAALTDVPLAIDMLGEELVAFRDGGGRVGVLHRHCCHRGASLEFGRIAERGIRCCYHGWHYDVDGTIIDTPGEPPGSRLKSLVSQGAYPTREAHGLVFAYMGPPDALPEFPNYDTFALPDTELVPYAIRHDCNWLQVHENLMDPFHAVFLHSRMGEIQLTAAWGEMPVIEWGERGDRMYYVASRRLGEHVWVRFNEVALPNFGQVAGFWEDGAREVLFQRVGATRWTVPIDDTHCWIFGLRHFSDELEAKGIGDKSLVGMNSLDIYGQTGGRPYDEMQRNPGDWEVEVSLRPIAIHALENRGATDKGVVQLRRQILRAIERAADPPASVDGVVPTYTSNTVLRVPLRNAGDDAELLRRAGRAVVDAVVSGNGLSGAARRSHITARLREVPSNLAVEGSKP
jgi:phenylpropionate dioxygenase-like ring-hydroxylating dioxygenase large terminal subunit